MLKISYVILKIQCNFFYCFDWNEGAFLANMHSVYTLKKWSIYKNKSILIINISWNFTINSLVNRATFYCEF